MNKDEKVFPMLDINRSYADGKRLSIKNAGINARDYIAIKAMQGLLAANGNISLGVYDMATTAYRIADAMIDESQQKSEE